MFVTLNKSLFQIDEFDWERLRHLPWRGAINGKGRSVITRQIRTNGKYANIYIQQDILAPVPAGAIVDHVNGDPSDHRRHNLRLCTYTQNAQNRRTRRDNSLGLKGVSRKKNRFVARITVNGKAIPLGSFVTPEQAARAYDAAALHHFGEFAWLNEAHGLLHHTNQG